MGIGALILAVNAELPIWDGVTLPRNGAIEVKFGQQAATEHSLPPRIIWIPRTSSFGGHDETVNPYPVGQRSIWSRAKEVEVRLWAKGSYDVVPGADGYDEIADRCSDMDASQDLEDLLLSALEMVAPGRYRPIASEDVDTKGADDAQYGRLSVLRLAISAPVVQAPTNSTGIPIALTSQVPAPSGSATLVQDTEMTFPDGEYQDTLNPAP